MLKKETASVGRGGFGKKQVVTTPSYPGLPQNSSFAFVQLGVATSIVIAMLAKRCRVSETRARLIAELADIRGGLE